LVSFPQQDQTNVLDVQDKHQKDMAVMIHVAVDIVTKSFFYYLII